MRLKQQIAAKLKVQLMTANSRIDFRSYYDGAYLEKRDVDCKNADLRELSIKCIAFIFGRITRRIYL